MEPIQVVEVNGEFVTYTVTDVKEGVFPGPVGCEFEMGIGGDMFLVNPLAGKRLWVAAPLDPSDHLYTAMIRAIEVAKELKFLG